MGGRLPVTLTIMGRKAPDPAGPLPDQAAFDAGYCARRNRCFLLAPNQESGSIDAWQRGGRGAIRRLFAHDQKCSGDMGKALLVFVRVQKFPEPDPVRAVAQHIFGQLSRWQRFHECQQGTAQRTGQFGHLEALENDWQLDFFHARPVLRVRRQMLVWAKREATGTLRYTVCPCSARFSRTGIAGGKSCNKGAGKKNREPAST